MKLEGIYKTINDMLNEHGLEIAALYTRNGLIEIRIREIKQNEEIKKQKHGRRKK